MDTSNPVPNCPDISALSSFFDMGIRWSENGEQITKWFNLVRNYVQNFNLVGKMFYNRRRKPFDLFNWHCWWCGFSKFTYFISHASCNCFFKFKFWLRVKWDWKIPQKNVDLDHVQYRNSLIRKWRTHCNVI